MWPAGVQFVSLLPALKGSNRPFQVLDVYWRSPESGVLWFKSRQFKKHVRVVRREQRVACGARKHLHQKHASYSSSLLSLQVREGP